MKLHLHKLGASPKIIGVPTSVDELRRWGRSSFSTGLCSASRALPLRDVHDMGVDGYSFFEQLPIQVKQRERVGRNDVDNFETAIERAHKHKGYIVAFSFARTAYEEAARAKREGRVEVVLVKVEDVVRVGDLIDSADREGRPPDLSKITPDLMGLFKALQQPVGQRPYYAPPREDTKPSAEDLIGSARSRRAASQQRLPVG